MSEHSAPDDDLDSDGDTSKFQAFVQRHNVTPPSEKAVGAPFRLVTLLIGLAVFSGLVWLLLKL